MKTLVTILAITGLLTVQSEYTGLWYRDDGKSDDAEPKLEATVKGFVEKNSRGYSTIEDVDPQVVSRRRLVLNSFVQYANELDVERTKREIVVDDDDNRLRIYYLDVRKHERQMADGTRLETTSEMTGTQIDVEIKTSDGVKIYETYQLSSDGDELVLMVRL
jgi:hypothetical protein